MGTETNATRNLPVGASAAFASELSLPCMPAQLVRSSTANAIFNQSSMRITSLPILCVVEKAKSTAIRPYNQTPGNGRRVSSRFRREQQLHVGDDITHVAIVTDECNPPIMPLEPHHVDRLRIGAIVEDG